jgi:hypothetical protein
MRTKLLLAASLAALLSGTMVAGAQNPPGAAQQDRGIREDLSKPGPKGSNAMPGDSRGDMPRGGTVGQGQPGPKGEAEPPGGRYQDEKTNEEAGKPPQGGK